MAGVNRMTTVKLYGPLRKFGREFTLNVKTPREAFRLLTAQIPEMEEMLRKAHLNGMEFAVFNGRRNISKEELDLGAKPEIRLAPVYGGRKRGGLLQTILGVVLIAVAVFAPVAAPFAAGLLSAGIGLAAGGIIQMMTKPPSGLSDSSDSDNRASYAFGQPVNTVAQGYPVSLWYGYREVGGAVVSAGIEAEDQSTYIPSRNGNLGGVRAIVPTTSGG